MQHTLCGTAVETSTHLGVHDFALLMMLADSQVVRRSDCECHQRQQTISALHKREVSSTCRKYPKTAEPLQTTDQDVKTRITLQLSSLCVRGQGLLQPVKTLQKDFVLFNMKAESSPARQDPAKGICFTYTKSQKALQPFKTPQ